MKTALLHYWLTNMRGGENVLAEIAAMYPESDIFTHAYNKDVMDAVFGTHRIFETFIGNLPGARKSCQKYLPLMPLALKKLDLSSYDLIISSESGPAKGIRKPENAYHVCYCNTPMRYLWDMYEDYYRSTSIAGKAAMVIFKNYLRKYDVKSADSVDLFIANSRFIAERIKRIYDRDSIVVYPPVDYGYFSSEAAEKKDYYLLSGQLISYKNPALAIEACVRSGKKLVVTGCGNMEKDLRKKYGGSVTFLGRVSRDELRRRYGEAKALIFPGIEDFGIVPLEAQSAGTPVIALGKGGALETVIPGRTGMFFSEPTVEALQNALEEFEGSSWSGDECRANASKFTSESFRANFASAVSGKVHL